MTGVKPPASRGENEHFVLFPGMKGDDLLGKFRAAFEKI